MVVDRVATLPPDYAVLVINLFADPGREFRAIPSQIQSVENNLSLANMDFAEFAESVDEDGVFRGLRAMAFNRASLYARPSEALRLSAPFVTSVSGDRV